MSILRPLTIAVSLATALPSIASAAAILTTYPSPTDGGSFSFSSTKWEAVGFRTGLEGSYDIDSVVMRLSGLEPGQVATGIYKSGLRTRQYGWSIDTGPIYGQYNAPDLLIGSQSVQVVGNKADYTFSFSDVTLEPSTLYWVVFKALGAENFKFYENDFSRVKYDPITWNYDWKSLYQSETGASIYDFAASPCSHPEYGCPRETLGKDWNYHSGLNIISINGSLHDIPEPSSLALAGLGIAGLVFSRKRHQTSQSKS